MSNLNRQSHYDQYQEEQGPYKKTKLNEDEQDEEDYELPDDIEDIDQDELLQAIQEAENDENLAFDAEHLEKLIKQFEHNILKNSQLRSEFPDKPEKFMESEIELDQKIKKFAHLSAYPELIQIFVQSSAIQNMILLLQHDNSDIRNEVINFIKDFVNMELEPEEEEKYAIVLNEAQDNFVKYGLFKGLFQNLTKLKEEKKEDFEVVFKILEIIEGILNQQSEFITVLINDTEFLSWLLKRIALKIQGKILDDNKLYCSEILVQILSNKEAQYLFVEKHLGVEKVIELLAKYKSTDPTNEEDKEYVLNLFAALQLLLIDKNAQDEFRVKSGIDLMLKMIKEKIFCSKPSLKTLMYALLNNPVSCNYFVEVQGLKYIAPIMIMKGIKSKKDEEQKQINEQVFSIFRSLIKDTKSLHQERVVNKFRESDFEKIDRLFELHNYYFGYINEIDRQMNNPNYIDKMKNQGMDDEEIQEVIYMKKIVQKVSKTFNMHNNSDKEVIKTISDLLKNLDPEESKKECDSLKKLLENAKNI
ncbi:Armadillo-type fold [Pseudocohnilembus persalinus]|uniref:Armadillo-type fold n=1 Tax=Pseudocohnilembus persalinus TaxID=266149 RepID=A0A0V0QWD3_PSEPJ|nr:Armadillo-type fold [Pseudocohnilembus persalinus]|eukprot:KRX06697.1 Armadillo-type fold [Pseudocohnilembus persalinus]